MKRRTIKAEELLHEIKRDFDEIKQNISLRAWNWFKSNIKTSNKFNEALTIVKNEGGMVLLPWCGNENCVRAVIEKEEGVEALGEVHQGSLKRLNIELALDDVSCAFCDKKAIAFIAIAKRH
uniref:Proline-tRNA ligase class II C-terminal domain-containing protein n=1 Tax=Ignisphaera aggregans TaxID=334771 RepID=A0A7C5Z0R1_9CREN